MKKIAAFFLAILIGASFAAPTMAWDRDDYFVRQYHPHRIYAAPAPRRWWVRPYWDRDGWRWRHREWLEHHRFDRD
jgi:hypothetical protein